jgi:hypothetical protein
MCRRLVSSLLKDRDGAPIAWFGLFDFMFKEIQRWQYKAAR